jgi:hypothetical protein
VPEVSGRIDAGFVVGPEDSVSHRWEFDSWAAWSQAEKDRRQQSIPVRAVSQACVQELEQLQTILSSGPSNAAAKVVPADQFSCAPCAGTHYPRKMSASRHQCGRKFAGVVRRLLYTSHPFLQLGCFPRRDGVRAAQTTDRRATVRPSAHRCAAAAAAGLSAQSPDQ